MTSICIALSLLLICVFNYKFVLSTCEFEGRAGVGERVPLCVFLSPINWNESGSYISTVSSPAVDEVSSVNIRHSWTSSNYTADVMLSKLGLHFEANNAVGVSVAAMGVTSLQKVFRKVTTGVERGVTFPLLMAIVVMDRGKVTGIYWDDHCKWCDSNACLPNTYDYMGNSIGDGGNACAIEDRECIEGGKTVTLCELHVSAACKNSTCDNVFVLCTDKRLVCDTCSPPM